MDELLTECDGLRQDMAKLRATIIRLDASAARLATTASAVLADVRRMNQEHC